MVGGGDLVREARRRAGLTQVELAERAETTQSAIARLESGRTDPTFGQLQRLLRACGFRLDVALDPYDDSDRWQAQSVLDTPVEQRLERLSGTVRRLQSLRSKFQEQQRRAS
jgi:transcriptional regulator with XRE-family HTH domain